jgi:hypothetical protein
LIGRSTTPERGSVEHNRVSFVALRGKSAATDDSALTSDRSADINGPIETENPMFRCSHDTSADAITPVIGATRAFGGAYGTHAWDSMSTAVDALVLAHQLKSEEGVLRGGDPGPA